MRITIKAIELDLTPSIKRYIEDKIGVLEKFLKRFEKDSVAECYVEIARVTRHHRHGDIYVAKADIKLPRKILRAKEQHEDVRKSIDALKNTLRLEVERFKTKVTSPRRAARKKE